jgi:predicted TIM-barrel fold metal-dependent hydrolase
MMLFRANLLVVAILLFLVPVHGEEKPKAPEAERTPLYKSTYRVLDIHAHCAVASEAAVRAHLEVLDRVGVHAFNVLLFDPTGWPYPGGWSEANLHAWLELRKKHPERLLVFGTVDYNRVEKEPTFFADIVIELERGVSRGMQGVKIWKNLGMIHKDGGGKLLRIDDERLDPFWKACGRLGIPVLIHTADPREYWYPKSFNTFQYEWPSTGLYWKHATVPKWEDLIEQRDRVLKKHPRTHFIGAHHASMSDDLDALARTLDDHPNLTVDCSARMRFMYRYHPKAIRDFHIKYQDRILFGSDNFVVRDRETLENAEALRTWQDRNAAFYSRYLEYYETDHVGLLEAYGTYSEWMRFTGVKLPPEVLEKFYHANAERLVPGLKAP